jgi:hypothetical protein
MTRLKVRNGQHQNVCGWTPLGLKVCNGQHQNVCVWPPLGLKVCNWQHQNMCVWASLGLKVCNGQHQNVCVWAPLQLKVCSGQHQNVCMGTSRAQSVQWAAPKCVCLATSRAQSVWWAASKCVCTAPLGLKVCNGQHQNVCVWAPLGHILDLENGAGREEKKKQAILLFCMGCKKDPICRFQLMKVCVHALLSSSWVGVNFSFPFFGGLRQNSCSLWVAWGLIEPPKGLTLFASFMMTLEEQFPNKQTPIALQDAKRV